MSLLAQLRQYAAPPRKLALVLSGGGARGALQVGALRALWEAGIKPDAWVGTSIGAVNAAFIALHGFTPDGLRGLESAWHDASEASLLPANYLWLSARVLFNRVGILAHEHRLHQFFIDHGLSPDLRFADLDGPDLLLVAADLNAHQPKLFGLDPNHRVLDGLQASTAIPPWVRPLDVDGGFLMDGGVVSNLPVEPAIRLGATEIIALDLFDPRPAEPENLGFGPFFSKLLATVENRQIEMELALAQARGVPVTHIKLWPEQPTATWDFSNHQNLITRGYHMTKEALNQYRPAHKPWYRKVLAMFRR